MPSAPSCAVDESEPMSFATVQGQSNAVSLLRADLACGRVPAAYLLSGPDGVGKRLLALQLAKAVNCDAGGGDACDQCPSCLKIERRNHADVWWVEPETAHEALKIEQIRELLPRFGLRPFEGRYQVLILVNAEQLTDEAASALLKTLEEPARSTLFVLTTANRAACLPTVISRCRLVPCLRLPESLIREALTGRHGVPSDAAAALARWSDGSLGRALARHHAGWWERQQELLGMIRDGQWQALGKEGSGDESRARVLELLELLIWSYRQRTLEASVAGDCSTAEALAGLIDWLVARLEDVQRYANAKLVWSLVVDRLQDVQHASGTGSPSLR